MDAGTPESQRKEVKGSSPLLPIGLGPGQERGGQGQGMPKLGLYLQGLEEAHGIRTAARDEAEGGIGQCCPRVGPKEAQEGSSTRGLRQLPFPPPGSLNGFPAPHQHPQIHNVQTHRVLYVNKTHAQPRTDTHVPASHLPLPTAGLEGRSTVLALPLPLVVLDTSLLWASVSLFAKWEAAGRLGHACVCPPTLRHTQAADSPAALT